MAERVETIRLTAVVSNYITGLEQARKKTLETATASQKLAQQGQAMTSLGHSLLLFGTAVAAGVAVAVKSFADFDAQMSQVKTLSHATAGDMHTLSEAALTLGQSIGISATQSADAEIELVKAGVSLKDIMGGALKGSLELAAAGQIDVADATEIATIALTQFKLSGSDVPHVADLLAAGADKALGGVQDLGEALKSGGLVASQFGVSIEETIGTLSAFANAGLIGETAGTDLRQMLLQLAAPSKQASDLMKQYGLNVYDASGKFIGLTALAGQLQKAFQGQTDATRNSAEAIIFGTRAINGANVLYSEGAKGIAKWTSEVDDTGFAAQQARGKMDNLNGDLSKLGAAFQTNVIRTGATANDVLRDSVQVLTNLVRAYGSLPEPIQGTVLAVGAVVAVLALVSGAILTIIPKVASFREALDFLGLSMKSIGTAGGIVGAALTALVVVLGAVASAQQQNQAKVDDYTASLDEQTGSITKNTRALVAQNLQQAGAFKAAKTLGVSVADLTSAALGNSAALSKVNSQLEAAQDKSLAAQNATASHARLTGAAASDQGKYATSIQAVQEALGTETGNVKSSIAAKKDLLKATDEGTDSTKSAADAYLDATVNVTSLNDQITQLTDTINKANGVGQDAVTANSDYRKALSDADQAIKEYIKDHGKSAAALDESTAAGSANAAMLAEIAKKGQDAADAQFALDGNTDSYVSRLQQTRNDVIQRALDLGATADQAQAIADKVAAIPTDTQIKVIADTVAAKNSLNDILGPLQAIKAYADQGIHLNIGAAKAAYGSANGNLFNHAQAFADGGFPTGIYAGTRRPLYKFAEPETRWEAFISGRPGQEARNRAIWVSAGQKLGMVGAVRAPSYSQVPAGSGSSSSSGPQVPVNIQVTGETDPQVFAAMAGNAVAVRVRGVLR